jgi:hypothetical protein
VVDARVVIAIGVRLLQVCEEITLPVLLLKIDAHHIAERASARERRRALIVCEGKVRIERALIFRDILLVLRLRAHND